ncbi:transmembrane protein 230-like isoform X2 [Boleophthalmus pectinirostris]|uniref:transmembrane protein 230-like isoform X2 n=1 Tax=Boleophthalmus pectinirostris TaxID=150288 RepID=UPI00242F197B|nr:transmembrane protein 230-like isoform X2 [Boleophthalmus pectinirostris]
MLKANRSTMLNAGSSNNKVKYSRLSADDDGYIDLQFKRSPPKVPYKAIALAIFLFLIGSLLILFGALLLSGTIQVESLPLQSAITTQSACIPLMKLLHISSEYSTV